MAARSTGSTTISFGLVSIPVKLYTATSSQSVSFNMLHAECGSRVKQQLICPVHEKPVERDETQKGYEVSKGQYVTFTNEELRLLEAERTNTIDIVEFVPASSVDFLQIDKTQYLGPDKGGHKAYALLGQAMERSEVVAIGRYSARGKSYVVMIRPYEQGLVMHQLFYADEVRPFSEVDLGGDVRISEAEQGLAEKLIEQLRSEEFDPSQYRDEYSDRVREAAQQKAQGMEITAAPEQPAAQIIDLFEALKRSIETTEEKTIKGPKKAEPREEKRSSKKKARAEG